MSYARFGENSDVYVYAHYAGYVQCCGCLLGDWWNFDTAEEIATHMDEHVSAGHKVPAGLTESSTYPDDDFVPMIR